MGAVDKVEQKGRGPGCGLPLGAGLHGCMAGAGSLAVKRAGDGWGRVLGLEGLLVAGPAYYPRPVDREAWAYLSYVHFQSHTP